MKKLTNVLALEMVLEMIEVQQNVELFDKITIMKDQFAKKNRTVGADGRKALTKDQQLNEKIKERILEELAEIDEPIQIKAFNELDSMKDYSNQKLSALFRALVKDGLVVRTEVKGTALFKTV